MSDKLKTASRFFAPWTAILGFFAGLGLLVWQGKTSTRHDWHTNFTRFHPMIAPDSMYQPSVDEMCAIVRARCRPDQILVIVGGNSILLGVGQPADRMWSRRLQALLGPHYAVINLAFRGAAATDGGAVVAEALRTEFPHQIYIANAAVMQGMSSIGVDVYRFIFLDAYYKGRLLPYAPREAAWQDALENDPKRSEFREENWSAKLDAYLYFHDFWNHWSYTRFFTFPTTLNPEYPEAYWPRDRFPDAENDFLDRRLDTRFSPEIVKADLEITTRTTELYYTAGQDGKWMQIPSAHAAFKNLIYNAFPEPLRKRTLILIGRSSPFYTRRLDANINSRDDLAYRECVADWIEAGYHSLEYGRDFQPEDYGDRSHLTTLGGPKLAAIVAPEIKKMAQELGYPKP